MALSYEDHWVWDSWYSPAPIDGLWHAYYLMAPKNDIDPELRHGYATIGHSTSHDLISWKHHGTVIRPGKPGTWNDRAIWTGCMVRNEDGRFSNFYTSTNQSKEQGLIQRIGRVVGSDPYTFHMTNLALEADSAFYERLDPNDIDGSKRANSWKEEAWRDPWVFFDSRDSKWHMLITARLKDGESKNRGTVGHAVSDDLETWAVLPPLSGATQFAHMEVFQLVETPEGYILVFCAGSGDIDLASGMRQITGTYSAPADSPTGPYHFELAELIDDGTHYAGRVVLDTDGTYKLLGFVNGGEQGFTGTICDPLPLCITEKGTFKMV